jgi:uncharacterized protein
MASGRRRSNARGSRSRARSRVGLILTVVALALIVLVAVIVDRQIRGYFTIPSGLHSPVASPQGLPLPPSTPLPQPSPVVSVTGPRVAIIIDDCGYNVKRCEQFLSLPIPVTLAILPLTPHAKQLAADALAAGKSVILHLPMEPESAAVNPGPGAILTDMTDDEVRSQVEADIDSVPGVPGANNHEGSKATSDRRVMRDVLEVFRERHLFFIDSMTSLTTVGAATAQELGIPTARRDIFLDDSRDLVYIEGQFADLQRVALKQGTAIAIGHPFDTTAEALKASIPKFEAAGISFVPAQTLVR